MKKQQDDFYVQLWEWLLEIGPWKTFKWMMLIGAAISGLLFWFIAWYTKHYR